MPFDDEDRALTERLKKKYEGRVVDRSHEEAMNGGLGVVRDKSPSTWNTIGHV
jgi:hypothetical protein